MYPNFTSVCLIIKGNGISNIHSKRSKKVLKMAIFQYYQITYIFNGRVVTTPIHSDFDGLPYTQGTCYDHIFCCKMATKE